MQAEQCGHSPGVTVLMVSVRQQLRQEATHDAEGKGRNEDKHIGLGDGKGLALAPHWQHNVREFLE